MPTNKPGYMRDYYHKHKEKFAYLSEMTECECGTHVVRVKLDQHLRTKKHENLMRKKIYTIDNLSDINKLKRLVDKLSLNDKQVLSQILVT